MSRKKEKTGSDRKSVNSLADQLAAQSSKPKGQAKAEHFKQAGTRECIEFDCMSAKIKTLEDLLEYAAVDLEAWEVDKFVVNKYDMGTKFPDGTTARTPLFQVKAWLKKRTSWSVQEFRQKLLDDMRQMAPRYRPVRTPRRQRSGLMYEISIFDHHVGKLCWAPETGNNYDLKIAQTTYMDAVEDLASRVRGVPLDYILFPIGNDFLHTDNAAGTTARGTPQDVEGRWQLQFFHAKRMIVTAVDRLREIAPVKIVVVAGNHDKERMFYLGDSVESWYRLDRRTSIDNGPALRKYVDHGIVLLGFTHGSEEKHEDLPRLMADEVPELWAKAHHREIHLGHRHKKKETRYVSTDTYGRTVVRILPSLSAVDAWHFSKGYVSQRCSEAYLWSKETGYMSHFSHMMKEDAERSKAA